MQTGATTSTAPARSTRRLTLVGGLGGGLVVGAVIPVLVQAVLKWDGTALLISSALILALIGIVVERVTPSTNWFGRGFACGVILGWLAVVAFFLTLALTIGS